MSSEYNSIPAKVKGSWVIHHSRKTQSTDGGGAAFPVIDAAGRAASLLSSLSASAETQLSKEQVDALAISSRINPKLELVPILNLLEKKKLIDKGKQGEIAVVGLTTSATAGHAAEIFQDLEPSKVEKATILAAECTSEAPVGSGQLAEYLGDELAIPISDAKTIVSDSSRIGFVDSEGTGKDELVFNGNIFRKENATKTGKILSGLSSSDATKVQEVDAVLTKSGCVALDQVETILGSNLLAKLRSAGFYDVQFVHNPAGQFGYVTKPAAFHKFQDPMVDDSFDLAKALVAALTYGMHKSSAGRGKISMVTALLRNLINGYPVGPATAIGQDYKVLEQAGVIRTWPDRYGFSMSLRKKDIGEMALKVITRGEAASENVSNSLVGSMHDYTNPEQSRWDFRKKNRKSSVDVMTLDVLDTLRTGGKF